MKVIILIPIYNDRESLFKLIEDINEEVKDLNSEISIIVVNDASSQQILDEYQNIQIAQKVCAQLDEIRPLKNDKFYASQIEYVEDRKGHDRHYAVDFTKASRELGHKPEHSIDPMIRNTIEFYLSLKKN